MSALRSSQSSAPRRGCKRRGTIVVLTAFLLVIFMCMMAFSIDVGYMNLWRTDLQNAADAGVLSGAALIPIGTADAESTAREYVARNLPQGVDAEDILVNFGYWNRDAGEFVPNGTPVDSIEVTVNRKEVPLFFAPMMGSRTFDTSASAVASYRPRDIMLVLDFSGSMNSHHKIDELKEAVDLFFGIIEDSGGLDRVGFVRYSTQAELAVPLTDDYAYINTEVQKAKANGWTNIGEGMEFARHELEDNAREIAMKMMVIMTDGKVNRPADRSPRGYVLDEAQKAADGNIQVFAISFGGDADKSLMQDVAETGKGSFFHVENGIKDRENDLRAVFEKIATLRPVILVD